MSALYAVGKPCAEPFVVSTETTQLDYRDLDLAFVDRQWPGWYSRLPGVLRQQAFEYLSHNISKAPHDLSSHLHRIIAGYYSGNNDHLYGALLDLFIVLDKRGFALRQRLLNKFSTSLSSPQRQTLRQGLLFGINSQEVLQHGNCSRFATGMVGNAQMVDKTGQRSELEFSVLDECRDLIDSGLFDDARRLLEEAIMRQPDDEPLNKELIELFKYTRDKDAFRGTREYFSGLNLALEDEWQQLTEELLMAEGVEE
jgi:hypothetical protein